VFVVRINEHELCTENWFKVKESNEKRPNPYEASAWKQSNVITWLLLGLFFRD